MEDTLGRFRRTLPDPDKIQIHTKYVPNKDTLDELTNDKIDAAVNRSLRRLGVEQLDLLQYHWWNYDVPGLDNLTERLIRAQEAGKICLLGVINFDTAHVGAIVQSGARIVSVQAQYSLLDRRPESQMMGLCSEKGVCLLPYGVLAGGFLTEKYLGAPPPTALNRSLRKYRLIIDEMGGSDAFQRLLQLLSGIASRHDTTIAAVAAHWILDRPGVAAIILGTGGSSRAKQNVGFGSLRLDAEDREKIAAQLQSQRIPPGDMYDLERDFEGRHSNIIKTNLHGAEENP